MMPSQAGALERSAVPNQQGEGLLGGEATLDQPGDPARATISATFPALAPAARSHRSCAQLPDPSRSLHPVPAGVREPCALARGAVELAPPPGGPSPSLGMTPTNHNHAPSHARRSLALPIADANVTQSAHRDNRPWKRSTACSKVGGARTGFWARPHQLSPKAPHNG